MERYLIALDLDGTTLNADGQLSAGTIAVLREAQAAGHLVVITTVRIRFRNISTMTCSFMAR